MCRLVWLFCVLLAFAAFSAAQVNPPPGWTVQNQGTSATEGATLKMILGTGSGPARGVCGYVKEAGMLRQIALVLLVAGHHPGILVVRRDNDPRRDLRPRGIVRALRNLSASGVSIPDQLHIVNHWR